MNVVSVSIMLALLVPSSVWASEYQPESASATILKLRGEVQLDGKSVEEGDGLFEGATLTTGSRSFVKFYVKRWGSEISLGPASSMKLEFSAKSPQKSRYTLRTGVCRWVTKLKQAGMDDAVPVHTKTAAMGIRGTDFKVIYRKTGESEIIVFHGKVLFQSKLADSRALVNAGQWGGVGGKFGKKVGKIVSLSADDLKKMKADVE